MAHSGSRRLAGRLRSARHPHSHWHHRPHRRLPSTSSPDAKLLRPARLRRTRRSSASSACCRIPPTSIAPATHHPSAPSAPRLDEIFARLGEKILFRLLLLFHPPHPHRYGNLPTRTVAKKSLSSVVRLTTLPRSLRTSAISTCPRAPSFQPRPDLNMASNKIVWL